MITTYTNGDLISFLKSYKGEMIFTAHGCNCHASFGAGYAPLIGKAFDGLHEVDAKYQASFANNFNMLGTFSKLETQHVTIYNAYTQFHGGRDLRLPMLGKAFKAMNDDIKVRSSELDVKPVLLIPLIGAGIAGGDWNEISKLIDENTPDVDVIVYIYK